MYCGLLWWRALKRAIILLLLLLVGGPAEEPNEYSQIGLLFSGLGVR